jgi:hypothetical protein
MVNEQGERAKDEEAVPKASPAGALVFGAAGIRISFLLCRWSEPVCNNFPLRSSRESINRGSKRCQMREGIARAGEKAAETLKRA